MPYRSRGGQPGRNGQLQAHALQYSSGCSKPGCSAEARSSHDLGSSYSTNVAASQPDSPVATEPALFSCGPALFPSFLLLCIFRFTSLLFLFDSPRVNDSHAVPPQDLASLFPRPASCLEMHIPAVCGTFLEAHDRPQQFFFIERKHHGWEAQTTRGPITKRSLRFSTLIYLRGVILEKAMPVGPAFARKRSGSITVGSAISHVYSWIQLLATSSDEKWTQNQKPMDV